MTGGSKVAALADHAPAETANVDDQVAWADAPPVLYAGADLSTRSAAVEPERRASCRRAIAQG
ncbi:MAG: hypothetical protein ABR511_07635 [Acidimicrobiales bacterium]